MNQLPGHPATGTFGYTDQDGQSFALPVTRAKFVLFKLLPGARADTVQLSVMVTVDPVDIPNAEDPEFPDRLCPTITTEWLEISENQFTARGKNALDGYAMQYDQDAPGYIESPAALQDESYGTVDEIRMSLTFESGGYRLRCAGVDEFNRRFDIDANIGLFEVGIRHQSGTQHAKADEWLAGHFDTSQMDVAWEKKGPEDRGWYDLYGRWSA